MRKTGFTFIWKKGNMNENAISVFEKNSIKWQYSHFGELEADFYGISLFLKVECRKIDADIFEICIAENEEQIQEKIKCIIHKVSNTILI